MRRRRRLGLRRNQRRPSSGGWTWDLGLGPGEFCWRYVSGEVRTVLDALASPNRPAATLTYRPGIPSRTRPPAGCRQHPR